MAQKFLLGRDISGAVTYGISAQTNIEFSVQFTVTTPGTPITVNVPKNATIAIFKSDPGASIWVNLNGPAVVPTTATPVNDLTELNPTVRSVVPGSTISVDATVAANVQISFYEGNNQWGNL
jgi:hypothetical protein